MKRIIGLVLLLIIPFAGWSRDRKEGRTVEIIILHTNDMHSKIDNMPKLAYLEDSLSRTHKYVFLVSSGDNFTGNPVVDMIADKGYPMIDLMNRCGFDVSAVGNHEFDMGQEMLNRRMKQARFPFISCNIDATGALLHQPAPYFVLKAGRGVRIAFLSAIELNENGIPDSHPSHMLGIRFTDGVKTMQEYRSLKEKYGILIGLTHLGVVTDSILALAMPELDVIMGGHSHTLLETPEMVNGVMITQAGSNLRYVGKTTLTVQEGKVIARRDEVIPISALGRGNTEVQTLVDKYNNIEEFRKVVGRAANALDGYPALGSLMTDALTAGLKTDFAFINRGGIRLSSLPAGDITLKDIYKLDPFGNQVVVYRMTPAEIRTLICHATERAKGLDLEVSGMTYTVTLGHEGKCIGIDMKTPDGKPLDPGKTYTVAINSYMSAAYKFDHADPGQTEPATSAEYLVKYLEEKQTVDYNAVRRASLVQE